LKSGVERVCQNTGEATQRIGESKCERRVLFHPLILRSDDDKRVHRDA
jgi:hypothetical protein